MMDWDQVVVLARTCQMSTWDQSQFEPVLVSDGFTDVVMHRVGENKIFVADSEDVIVVSFWAGSAASQATDAGLVNSSERGRIIPEFFCAAGELKEGLREALEELDPEGEKEIRFAGHGIGAGIALASAVEFPDPKRIKWICCFGMPAIGDSQFRHAVEKNFRNRILRFSHNSDSVCLLDQDSSLEHVGMNVRLGDSVDFRVSGSELDRKTGGDADAVGSYSIDLYVGDVLNCVIGGVDEPWKGVEDKDEEKDLPPLSIHVLWGRKSNAGVICPDVAEEIYSRLSHAPGLEPGVEKGAGIPVYVGHHYETVKEHLERPRTTRTRDSRLVVALLLDKHSNQDDDLKQFIQWLFADKDQEKRFWPYAIILPVRLDNQAEKLEDIPNGLCAVDATSDEGGIPAKKGQAAWGVAAEVAHFLTEIEENPSGRKERKDNHLPNPDVSIFVSYCRRDATDTEHIAEHISKHPKSRIDTFFDVQTFRRGGRIDDQIEKLQKKAVTLVVKTDSYSLSPYCQDEILNAKQAGTPIVTLQVLTEGKGRSFPYEANTLTLAGSQIVFATEGELDESKESVVERCGWACLRAWIHHKHFHLAAKVIYARRSVGLQPHFLSRPPELLDFVEEIPGGKRTSLVLYPDPPLGVREADLIRRSNPRVRLATPTTFSRETMQRTPTPPLEGMRIAFSLSDSPELSQNLYNLNDGAKGMAKLHLDGVAEYITLSLVRAGGRLGYGGHFGSDGYTNLLAALVSSHKRVKKSNQNILFSYLANHLPPPNTFDVELRDRFSTEDLPDEGLNRVIFCRDREEKIYLRIFDFRGDVIFDRGEDDLLREFPDWTVNLKQNLVPLWSKPFPDWNDLSKVIAPVSSIIGQEIQPKGPAEVEATIIRIAGTENKGSVEAAWNFSIMRKAMAYDLPDSEGKVRESCDARVVVGGKTTPKLSADDKNGYSGRFPGQAEEAWQHFSASKPVYIVGGFYGSTRQVARAICGNMDGLPTDAHWSEQSEYYKNGCHEYDANRPAEIADLPSSLDELWEDFKWLGKGNFWGPGADDNKLWEVDGRVINGLTVGENRKLFEADQHDEISSLIIKGLSEYRHNQKDGDPLTVALFNGSIVDVLDVDAYAVLILGSARLRGADAALDSKLGGTIQKKLENESASVFDRIIPVNSDHLSGDFVIPHWIDDLHSMGKSPQETREWLMCSMTDGLAKIASRVRNNDIRSLAVVPMAVNIGLSLEDSLGVILDVFQNSHRPPKLQTLAICELDPKRYDEAKTFVTKRSEESGFTWLELPSQPVTAGSVASMYLQFQGDEEISDLSQTATVSQIVRGPGSAASVPVIEKSILWEELSDQFYCWGNSAPPFSKHEELGERLANWFFDPEIKEALLEEGLTRPWDILHDEVCSAVPFELMRMGPEGGKKYLSLAAGMRRGLLVKRQSYYAPPVHRATYHVLMIVNPTGDLNGAEIEGRKVREILEEEFGQEHSLPRMEITSLLREQASLENVLAEVSTGKYDFIHYAGHGDFVQGAPEKSGLILSGKEVLTAKKLEEGLSALRNRPAEGDEEDPHPPALILLNACLSSRIMTMRERDGFGVSLAQAVLQSGVGGFIGNRWTVGDSAAKDFAVRIFSDLANGVMLGDAIKGGRELLYNAEKKDWCNYVFYGSPEIRL